MSKKAFIILFSIIMFFSNHYGFRNICFGHIWNRYIVLYWWNRCCLYITNHDCMGWYLTVSGIMR